MILTEIAKTRGIQLDEDEFNVMTNLMESHAREKIYSDQLRTFIWGSEEMLGLGRNM